MMTLEKIAQDIALETGAPIEVCRVYLQAFVRSPEAQRFVVAAARSVTEGQCPGCGIAVSESCRPGCPETR